MLSLASQGATPKIISETLHTHYGLNCAPPIVAAALRGMGLTGTKALTVTTQREMQALQAEAMSAYLEFRSSYIAARDTPFDLDDPESARIILEEKKFAADQFGKWWDRMSRFYPLSSSTDSTSTTNNIVAIIAQEAKNGLTPDAFERIINRMDNPAGSTPIATDPDPVPIEPDPPAPSPPDPTPSPPGNPPIDP